MSSVVSLRCWVKSTTSANLVISCLRKSTRETAVDKTEEGGDDVNHHAPYVLGYPYYNGGKQRSKTAGGSKI